MTVHVVDCAINGFTSDSRCWSMLFCVFYADLRLKRVVFQAQFLTRSEEALPVTCDHHHHLYSLYTVRTSGCQ